MMQDEDDTKRLADLLAGRLSAEEAAEFQERLARDPDADAWARLADGIKAAEAEGEPSPGEYGWARLSRSIDADQRPTAPARAWRIPAWQAAAAVVLGIGLWQAAIVPVLSPDDAAPSYTTASGDVEGVIRVAFVPTATEAELRVLLRDAGAQIVSGPSAIGLYTVAPRDGLSPDELIEALSARPDLVEEVSVR
ncbi:MAG: hypothetical protein AAGH38_04710 [Pseudomonadota bacterium]